MKNQARLEIFEKEVRSEREFEANWTISDMFQILPQINLLYLESEVQYTWAFWA